MSTAPTSERKQQQPSSDASMEMLTGQGILDRAIRQSVQHCWIIMPAEKRSVAAVAVEMRRILDRALDDLKEYARTFNAAS